MTEAKEETKEEAKEETKEEAKKEKKETNGIVQRQRKNVNETRESAFTNIPSGLLPPPYLFCKIGVDKKQETRDMREADEVKSRVKFRQEVIKIEKSKGYYIKMKPSLVEELDKRYTRLGYANRSDLFTAFAYTIIDRLKTKEDDLIFTCAKDLRG